MKHLREIGETIDALLLRFESEEKLDQPASDTSRTSQTTSTQSPRPWVFDVLNLILAEGLGSDDEDDEDVNDPKDILRRHYEECPWFYEDTDDNNNNCKEVNCNIPIEQELHDKKKKNDDSLNPEAILRKHRQLNPSFYTAQRSESMPDLDHRQPYYLAESKPWSSNNNIASGEGSKDRFHAGAKKMNFFEKFYRKQMRRYNSSSYKSR